MRGTVVLVLAGLIAPGCGDDAVSTCVPGMTITCPCAGGRSGSQMCGGDGTFGPCQCLDDGGTDAGIDAAPADAAGSDGGMTDGGGDAGPGAECDPLVQDCPMKAEGCYLSAGGSVCSTAGVLFRGQPCTVQEDCRPGLTCARRITGGASVCASTCDYTAHPGMADGDHCRPADLCCRIADDDRHGVCSETTCDAAYEIAPLRGGG